MSLIVARKYKDNLIILSDTKLTYRHEERNRPQDGTIKTIALSPHIAVCYAGDTHFAELALKEIADKLDEAFIKSILLKYHRESGQGTDFILALGLGGPSLIEIKNDTVTETDNSWIGSYDGFNQYQASFLSESDTNAEGINETTIKIIQMPDTEDDTFRSMYSKMFDAMVDVIEGHKVNEVGGFIIPLVFENNELQYKIYLRLFRKPIDIETELADKQWTAVNFSTVEDGAYIVNFSGGKADQLAIHFPHGNIGALYSREDYGLLNPTIYPEMDEIDFSEFLDDNPKVSLGFSVNHGAANYAVKAQKEFNEGNFENALTRITQSVNQASKSWGPNPDKNAKFDSLQEYLDAKEKVEIPHDQVPNLEEIFILKGKICLALKDYQAAILAFREALTLNETSYDGFYLKGIAQANTGVFEEAIVTFTDCIKNHENAEPYYSRGAVHYHMGNYILAQIDFEMALTIDENHQNSKYALLKIKNIQG